MVFKNNFRNSKIEQRIMRYEASLKSKNVLLSSVTTPLPSLLCQTVHLNILNKTVCGV